MKTVELGPDAPAMSELLNMANDENLILRAGDGREYLLAEMEDLDQEVELIRRNQELMAFLDERSREAKTYSAAQVREILAAQTTGS